MQIVYLCDLYKILIIILKHKTEYEDVFHVLLFSIIIIIK